MKYRDRDELVKSLRDYADFIEEKGIELPIRYPNMTQLTWIYPEYDENGEPIEQSAATQMANIARTLGSCKKDWSKDFLDISKNFGVVKIQFTVNRKGVCKKNVVDTIQHEERVVPAWTEEVIEWECAPSLLAHLEPSA